MKRLLLSLIFLTSCQQQETLHLRKKVIKEIYPAIVEVVVPKLEDEKIKYQRPLPWDLLDFKERNDKYHSVGTAFFINDKSLISAAHVFAPDSTSFHDNFFIRDQQGQVHAVDKIERFSAYRDVIQFNLKSYPQNVVTLELEEKVEIGDMVYAVGNAQGEGISTRGGQVSTFTPEHVEGKWNFIRFSSPTSPGNSGGPLVNSKGRVVGIVVMKNGSENLNYALPVQEIKNAPLNEAVFYERQLRVQDGMQVVAKDWKAKSKLPASFKELNLFATDHKNRFFKDLIAEFGETYKELLFPYSPRFSDALRYQRLFPRVSLVQKDQALQNWHLKEVELTKIFASPDNILFKGAEDIFNLTLILKNEPNKSTLDLFNDPRRMANRMAQAIGARRSMADQQIPIVDYGEPDKVEMWRDALGRPWKSATWNILHNSTVIVGHFTPTPEGVYSFFDQRMYSNHSSGYMHFVKGNIRELNLGYTGSIGEWVEFMKLPKDLLPTVLHPLALDFKKIGKGYRGNLSFANGSIKGLFFPNEKQSQMSALINYDPTNPLSQKLQGFELLTHKIREDGQTIFYTYPTSSLAPDWAKERWYQLQNREAHYDGKVHQINGRLVVKFPLATSDQGGWWMSCFSLATQSKSSLLKSCKSLKKRTKIQN